MKRLASVLSLSLVLAWLLPAVPACIKEVPEKVDDRKLGYKVTFPGRSIGTRDTEQTPFGEVDWFGRMYTSVSRFDQTLSVRVGSLPAGGPGGDSEEEILSTAKTWISGRFPGQIFDLDAEHGPGFDYASKTSSRAIHGEIVLRRGWLYHVQASALNADDPQLKTFLRSFQVDKDAQP